MDDELNKQQAPELAETAAIPRFNMIMTGVFALATLLTHVFAESLDLTYAIYCSVLSALGVMLFLLGFWNGVQRSRIEDVNLSGLLAVAPSHVGRAAALRIWLVIVAQIAIAATGTALRPFTQQTFGLLVPMFGVGLAALWGSRYAKFHPREDR